METKHGLIQLDYQTLLEAVDREPIIAVQEAHAWGAATGDGQDYRQLQETAIFFNNSGAYQKGRK